MFFPFPVSTLHNQLRLKQVHSPPELERLGSSNLRGFHGIHHLGVVLQISRCLAKPHVQVLHMRNWSLQHDPTIPQIHKQSRHTPIAPFCLEPYLHITLYKITFYN